MAKPTQAMLHPVNQLLTRMVLSFQQADDRFVATRAIPSVGMSDESGTYITFDQNYWQTDQTERRAYGDTYARAGHGMGTDTYATVQYALEHPMADELVATSQVTLSLEQIATRWLAQQSAIRKEREFATAYIGASIWGTTNTTANDWDTSTGTPVTDVLTAKRTISQASGQGANSGICGEIVWDALLVNAQLEGRLQYTRTLTIVEMEGLVAAALGLQNLYVSKAIRNTANLAATATYAAIIDDDFLVYANDPGAGVMGATAAKRFSWAPGGGDGQTRTYPEPQSSSTVAQHKEQWVHKVVASALGYIFTDIV